MTGPSGVPRERATDPSETTLTSAPDSDATVIVNRWRRYGKDRLYVTRGDETKVGWWDLLTDEAHPESTVDLLPLTEAVARWRAETASAAASPAAAPALSVAPAEPEALPEVQAEVETVPTADETPATQAATRPWIDLATNQPGAEAREQALAAKDAAPVRTLFARALGVHTDERAWRIGAAGEEKVAARLAKVARKDPRWRFIHAIPVGSRGADIDHLIIGPGGVFTANAKHHPGAKIWVGGNTFMVNGTKQHYIRNARHEAERASEILSAACGFPVHVEGVIVTVNAEDVVVKNQPAGVTVVPRMQVARWLLRHGGVLDEPTIEAIFDVARRSTTWRS
jgi:hypothetical protein